MDHLEDDDFPILRRQHHLMHMETEETNTPEVFAALLRILSNIECLKFKYDFSETASYAPYVDPHLFVGVPTEYYEIEFEYGTIPKQDTLSKTQRTIYGKMKNVLIDVCNRFPHNEHEDEPELDPMLDPTFNFNRIRKWCKTTISMYPIQKQDGSYVTCIDFSNSVGDIWTIRWIYYHISENIDKEILWVSRSNYLAIFEGCPTAEGHIVHYLFDKLLVQEICTFIAPAVDCCY